MKGAQRHDAGLQGWAGTCGMGLQEGEGRD